MQATDFEEKEELVDWKGDVSGYAVLILIQTRDFFSKPGTYITHNATDRHHIMLFTHAIVLPNTHP